MATNPPIERLLEEASWARDLARRLVADSAAADDVVQEAWLAAVRHPPEDDRPLRPWLAEVVRNAARKLQRGERRRRTRESAVTPEGPSPGADRVVEKAEAQRALVAAVLALPEPERHTVLLRWFEGLSAAEIARRERVPAPTVRWRLQKGLAALRKELDARFGGSRGWALLLIALAAPRATAGSLVATKAAAALVACVVVAVGAFAWNGARDERRPTAARVATTATSGAVGAQNVAEPAQVSQDLPRRAVRDAGAWTLRVLATDDLRPIDGARIEVSASDMDEPVAAGRAGSDGACSVDCGTTDRVRLRVEADGFATLEGLHLATPRSGEVRTVALQREAVARLRVIDAATGAPVAGAGAHLNPVEARQVRARILSGARSIPGHEPDRPVARADAEGCMVLRGLLPGWYELTVHADGHATRFVSRLELPGRAEEIIALERGHAVDVVVRRADGSPAGDVRVGFHPEDPTSFMARTDARGRARSPGFAAGATLRVQVIRDDLGPVAAFHQGLAEPLRRTVVVPVDGPVELVMPAGRSHPVRVRWEGEPDDELEIELLELDAGLGVPALMDEATVAATEGTALLAAYRGTSHRVVARGTRSGIWQSDVVRPLAGQEVVAQLVETVPRSCRITGRVAFGQAPVVRLWATPDDLGIPHGHLTKPAADEVARTVCGATGEFEFADLLPGRYVVEARGAEVGARSIVTVAAGESRSIVLEPVSFGSLRGEIRGHDRSAVWTVSVVEGETRIGESTLVDPEGGFTLPRLLPGRYELRVQAPPGHADVVDFDREVLRNEPDATVAIEAGREARITVGTDSRTIEVRLRGLSDSAAVDVTLEKQFVFDRVGSSVWTLSRPLPRDGGVRFTGVPRGASFGVVARDRGTGCLLAWTTLARSSDDVTVTLRADQRTTVRVAGDVDQGHLALVPIDGNGVPLRESVVRGARAPSGDIVFDAVPSGSYRLAWPLATDHLTATRHVLDVVVAPGRNRFELRN